MPWTPTGKQHYPMDPPPPFSPPLKRQGGAGTVNDIVLIIPYPKDHVTQLICDF